MKVVVVVVMKMYVSFYLNPLPTPPPICSGQNGCHIPTAQTLSLLPPLPPFPSSPSHLRRLGRLELAAGLPCGMASMLLPHAAPS